MRWFYRTDRFSTKKSIGPTWTTKMIENNMLDRRFAVAPLMDWSESLGFSNS
jgi:hypothetical protein